MRWGNIVIVHTTYYCAVIIHITDRIGERKGRPVSGPHYKRLRWNPDFLIECPLE